MTIRLVGFCMLVSVSALQVDLPPSAVDIVGESKILPGHRLQLQTASKRKDNNTRVNENRLKFTNRSHVANDDVQQELIASIHSHARFHPLEDAMGDVSMADMLDMIEALATAVKSGGLVAKVKAVISDLGTDSAKFAEQAKEKAEKFKIEAQDAYDEGFVTLVATYLNETLWLQELHTMQSLAGKSKIVSYLPQELQDKLKLVFSKMHASNFTLPDFSFQSFNSTTLHDICSKVSPLGHAIAQYQHNLTEVHEMLNSTTDMLPLLTEFLPDTPKDVVNFLHEMLGLADTELRVQEDAIKDLTEISVPVILEKTGCEWSRACSHLSLGLFSVVATIVLGIFRGL